MGGIPVPLRKLIFAAAVAVLALTASSAAAAPSRATAARPVHRGSTATIVFRTRARAACDAFVQYADGVIQDSGVKHARGGRVAWTVRIPTNAALGLAHWHAACGAAVHASGAWLVAVVAGTGPGVAADPRVVVDKFGFTERPPTIGGGSDVSYGLFLHNTSATQDALNVYVLINFVTADGQLDASVTKNVNVVYANSVWALGDHFTLRNTAQIVKLEITVKVMDHRPTQAYALPHFTNVQILPGQFDQSYVGEVDGEIVNDSSPHTLNSANLSIVLLDANGNIVGGGTGMIFSPLPSGSRMVFLAQSGFSAVPAGVATQAIISVEPTYAND
jgi:hypothetical protein